SSPRTSSSCARRSPSRTAAAPHAGQLREASARNPPHSGHFTWSATETILRVSSVAGSAPSGAKAAHVNVSERPMSATCGIDANAAYERGVLSLHAIGRLLNDFGVARIDASVMVEVIHRAVAVVVDEDVRRVAVHVAAQVRATGGVAAVHVVSRGTEAA